MTLAYAKLTQIMAAQHPKNKIMRAFLCHLSVGSFDFVGTMLENLDGSNALQTDSGSLFSVFGSICPDNNATNPLYPFVYLSLEPRKT